MPLGKRDIITFYSFYQRKRVERKTPTEYDPQKLFAESLKTLKCTQTKKNSCAKA